MTGLMVDACERAGTRTHAPAQIAAQPLAAPTDDETEALQRLQLAEIKALLNYCRLLPANLGSTAMSLITLNLPATTIIGAGARHELVAQMKRLGVGRALIVTDAFLQQTGLPDALASRLREASFTATIFAEVQPDPTDLNVAAGRCKYFAKAARM